MEYLQSGVSIFALRLSWIQLENDDIRAYYLKVVETQKTTDSELEQITYANSEKHANNEQGLESKICISREIRTAKKNSLACNFNIIFSEFLPGQGRGPGLRQFNPFIE